MTNMLLQLELQLQLQVRYFEITSQLQPGPIPNPNPNPRHGGRAALGARRPGGGVPRQGGASRVHSEPITKPSPARAYASKWLMWGTRHARLRAWQVGAWGRWVLKRR